MDRTTVVVLKDLLDKYGSSLVSNPSRLESYLRDFMTNVANSERLALIAVSRANLLQSIAVTSNNAITALQIEKWVAQIHDETGMDAQLLKRSILIWAAVFDRSVEDDILQEKGTRFSDHAQKAHFQREGAPNQGSMAGYFPGLIELPLRVITTRILHDGVTAIVGGERGELIAVDLRSGSVVAQAGSWDKEDHQLRPGGGETQRVTGDRLFLLSLSDRPNSFYTMTSSGVLKTWVFDGSLRLLDNAPILKMNHAVIRETIITARKRAGWLGWSSWTCYSGDIRPELPTGIVDACIAGDRRTILLLTDWFAIFRCELNGNMLQPPLVIPDAFNIIPSNFDGSRAWIFKGSLDNRILEVEFGTTNKVKRGLDMGRGANGPLIQVGKRFIAVGTQLIDVESMSVCERGDIAGRISVNIPGSNQIAFAFDGMIRIIDLTSRKISGDSLSGGHFDSIRDIDLAPDREHLVSVATNRMRIWHLPSRSPVGGRPPHSLLSMNLLPTRKETLLSQGRVYVPLERGACVIDIVKRSFDRIEADLMDFGGTLSASGREVFLFALATRPGKERSVIKGLATRWLGMAPPEEYLLQAQVISGNKIDRLTPVPISGPECDINNYGNGFEPPHYSSSRAIAIGDGRAAMLLAGHLGIYDTSRKAFVWGPKMVYNPHVAELVASIENELLAIYGDRNSVVAFDLRKYKIIAKIKASSSDGVLFVPGTPWLAIGNGLWDARTGSQLGKLSVSVDANRFAFLSSTVVAIAGHDGLLAHDLVTGSSDMLGPPMWPRKLLKVPGADELAAIFGHDGTCRFWDYPASLAKSGRSADQLVTEHNSFSGED